MLFPNQTRTLKPPLTQHGFTLIEALVGVAIIGVLTALAMPNFTQSIQRYRVNAVRDDFSSSLQLARITAMTQGRNVFISRISPCAGVTLSGTNDWSCGWRIIVDTNDNNTLNATFIKGTNPIATRDMLIQTTLVPTGYTALHFGTGLNTITINRWGQLAGVGHNFNVGPNNFMATDPTSVTCITSGGRVRYKKDVWNDCS